jgi:hypothetical protein
MFKLSVKVPVAVGAKATVIVQDAVGAMAWFEQVSVFGEECGQQIVEPTAPLRGPHFRYS